MTPTLDTFSPVLHCAVTPANPAIGATRSSTWLGLTFGSKFNGSGMTRDSLPPLALTLVLDVSGSMSLRFSDQEQRSKLEVAKRCIAAIVSQLRDCDALAIATFNHTQSVLIPPQPVVALDKEWVLAEVDAIGAGGGTRLSQGLDVGLRLTGEAGEELQQLQQQGGQQQLQQPQATTSGGSGGGGGIILRRTVFLTDMQSGPDDEAAVVASIRAAALSPQRSYTSVVGVGVDLSRAAVNRFATLPGCAYISVSSAAEFEASIAADFWYDVMPLAFDVQIGAASKGSFVLDAGYGSAELGAVAAGAASATLSCEFPYPDAAGAGAVASSGGSGVAHGAMRLLRVVQRRGRRGATGRGKNKVAPAKKGAKEAAAVATPLRRSPRRSPPVTASNDPAVGAGDSCSDDGEQLSVRVTWRDYLGTSHSQVLRIQVPHSSDAAAAAGGAFTSPDIRKAVALVRYVDALTDYALHEAGDGGGAVGNSSGGSASVGAHYLNKFVSLRQWLSLELAAVGDHSVFGKGGSNVAIAQTLDQIIGFETDAVTAASGAAAAAATSAAAKDAVGQLYGGSGASSNCSNSSAKAAGESKADGETARAAALAAFCCPITQDVMTDPVFASDGHTYERAAIQQWLLVRGGDATSPVTGLPLTHHMLTPNHALRAAIEEQHSAKEPKPKREEDEAAKQQQQRTTRPAKRAAFAAAVTALQSPKKRTRRSP